MKKHLIAAAVAATVAAPAMAQNVTLGGNIDFALGTIKMGTDPSETTVSTRDLTSSTSVINIQASEDLGGGMRATFKYGLDPRRLSNDNSGGVPSTGAAPTPGVGTQDQPGLQRDEVFVGVSGGFGNLRLGSPNSIGLTTFLMASPLGTGIGSGYEVTAGDYSFIRHNRSVRYDSPSIGGMTFSLNYAPGSETVIGAAAIPTIPQASQVTEIGAAYSAGPLSVGIANVALATRTNPTAAVQTSTNILAARYALSSTSSVSVGWNDGEQTGGAARTASTSAVDTKGYRIGASHAMGAVTLHASYAQQTAKTVAAVTTREKVTGVRVDYALSKRSAVYGGYEKYESGAAFVAATATAPATGGDRTITSVGIRHSF